MPKTPDAPIVCQRCLGESDKIRMVRDARGKQCKLCTRPYPTFRWRTNTGYANTRICQGCARRKGLCQVCILDLSFGLTISLRDAALKVAGTVADTPGDSAVARRYHADTAEKAVEHQNKVKAIMETVAQHLAIEPTQVNFDANEAIDQDLTLIAYLRALPIFGKKATHFKTLFILGIEPDLNEEHVRSRLNALDSFETLSFYADARCAFVNYADKAQEMLTLLKDGIVVDGVKLTFLPAHEHLQAPPKSITPKVGNYLRNLQRKLESNDAGLSAVNSHIR